MDKPKVTPKQIDNILDLYTCCPENQIKNIAAVVGLSNETVSRIIQKFYLGQIEYEKPNNLLILHSSINTHWNYEKTKYTICNRNSYH